MRVILTGSSGQLGQAIDLLKPDEIELIKPSRKELDLENKESCFDIVKRHKPDWIINTAAFTNVDSAETNIQKAFKINYEAPKEFSKAILSIGGNLLHISTDFVFDGKNGPYSESDSTNPLHYYAESKLASEKIVQKNCSKWSIARTIIIYGITDNMSRSNLVLWAKGEIERGNKINVVNDQFRSPTLAEDLADGCIAIMDKKAYGLYHLSGPKTYSIIEMVNLVADYYDLDRSLINPVSSASLNQPAKRPLKTGFDISKARNDLDYDPVDFLTRIKIMDRQLKQQHEN